MCGGGLWEMHVVWEWDSMEMTSAVLIESYFLNDLVTVCWIDSHSSRLWV
jgi:hypothetical protein